MIAEILSKYRRCLSNHELYIHVSSKLIQISLQPRKQTLEMEIPTWNIHHLLGSKFQALVFSGVEKTPNTLFCQKGKTAKQHQLPKHPTCFAITNTPNICPTNRTKTANHPTYFVIIHTQHLPRSTTANNNKTRPANKAWKKVVAISKDQSLSLRKTRFPSPDPKTGPVA